MWALAFAIYMGCKWLTWRRTPLVGVPLTRHIGYLLAWPGMDAAAFLESHGRSPLFKPSRREWQAAVGKLLMGIAILFVAVRCVPRDYPYLVGWVGMIGMVMALHFGLCAVLSCWWRSVGVKACPLMNSPLASVSVGEFWGRRWNTAFRDLTYRFLFRPLAARLGARPALFTGFIFSGLIHELVISVPAGAGYGGPTLFFALQSVGIFVERSERGQRLGLGKGRRGWLFTMGVLLVPLCGLLHRPFVGGVIVPFLHVMGATS